MNTKIVKMVRLSFWSRIKLLFGYKLILSAVGDNVEYIEATVDNSVAQTISRVIWTKDK